MLRYETLILSRPEITEDELSLIERQIDKLVTTANGSVSTFEKWGKYRLCFPVNKNEYGVYILVRYNLPELAPALTLKEIESFLKLKCNEFVMRFVHKKLHKNAPTQYAKPDAIDMNRPTNLDSFLKENKMENLLSSEDSSYSDESHDKADDLDADIDTEA